MIKNNDTDFIFNEAKIADAKDILSDIKHQLVDVDYVLYDAIVKITGANGIEEVKKEDYSIDLTNPEKQMEQSRGNLKEIMDTLDKQIDTIQKFLNKNQDSTEVKKPEAIENNTDNVNPEGQNKETTFTKEQILGEEPVEETVKDITEGAVGGDAVGETIKEAETVPSDSSNLAPTVKLITEDTPKVIYGPPSMMDSNNDVTPTTQDSTFTTKISKDFTIGQTAIYGPPSMMVTPPEEVPTPIEQPVNVTPTVVQPTTTVVNPAPVTTVVTPEPVASTTTVPVETPVSTKVETPVTKETIKSTTSIKSSTPTSSTKYTPTSALNSSMNTSGTDSTISTANREETLNKTQIGATNSTTRSSIDSKVIGGAAAAGAALLGAVGIGVAATSKKKEKDTDDSFNNNQNYYQTDENYSA
ncbi:MAG: hypothetical protein IJ193_09350 [Bacilli bacterium]|nr:hypothetical protein [Bacilli bacterium]